MTNKQLNQVEAANEKQPTDIKELKPRMRLRGKVIKAVLSGAFVDIGVGQDGLIHISELSDDYVRRVEDVATVMEIPEAEFTPKVRAAIMALMEEVARLRQELGRTQRRVEHLEQLADQDALAPIANRRAFVREMSRIMSFSQRYGAPSSVLYFDLNGMKEINDTYGHAAGDAALLRVAHTLLDSVRESDVVGRLGGDEFGVLLAQADQNAASEKAAALATAIAGRPLVWEDDEIGLTVAYGAYCFQPNEDVSTALANADRAMYANKQRIKGGR
jgi:diguanylate cyclase (GGDEF)-like protein